MILVVYLKLKESTSLGNATELALRLQANALQLSYICGVNMLYEKRIKGYLYRSNNLSWYVLLVLSRTDSIKI